MHKKLFQPNWAYIYLYIYNKTLKFFFYRIYVIIIFFFFLDIFIHIFLFPFIIFLSKVYLVYNRRVGSVFVVYYLFVFTYSLRKYMYLYSIYVQAVCPKDYRNAIRLNSLNNYKSILKKYFGVFLINFKTKFNVCFFLFIQFSTQKKNYCRMY